MTPRALGIGSAILVLAGPAFAHHSFAMFDYNKHVTCTEGLNRRK
jgi:hypothetical protein